MANVPKKVAERIAKQLPVYQRILTSAKDRDVNESDTVTIIADMLADVFGFDKYAEITSEFAVRSTYCDLAVKLDDKIKYLTEVKAVGMTLKDNHLRQAVNYGANHGIQWIVLTNGINWDIHKIRFEKPISHELTCSINFLEMSGRKKEDVELLYLLCREGLNSDAIEEFHEHVQFVNKFVVGSIIQSEPVLKVIRRELRNLSPGAKVSLDEIAALLPDVLKRDVTEGDSAQDAEKLVRKLMSKATKRRGKKSKPVVIPVTSGSDGDGLAGPETAVAVSRPSGDDET